MIEGRKKNVRAIDGSVDYQEWVCSPQFVWPGKHSQLLLQPGAELRCLERVGAPSEERLAVGNLLINGDNLKAMSALMSGYRGKIDLIYIDPPFAVGADMHVETGSRGSGAKGPARSKVVAYSDRWGRGQQDYYQMIFDRLLLMRELLSERGSIYVHVDYRMSAPIRLMLDEIFSADSFVNEIIWFYKTGGVPQKIGFGRKHDTIYFYAINPDRAIWNGAKERSYLSHRYGFSNVEIFEDRGRPYTMVNCRDVWEIPALRGNQPERVRYPTQKPEALLERIILASSNPGDLVADFFCGSGTTAVVAQRLGRRWIACDEQRLAVDTARARLSADPTCPFAICELC